MELDGDLKDDLETYDDAMWRSSEAELEVGADHGLHAEEWSQLEAQWRALVQEYCDDMNHWGRGGFWNGETWMDVQLQWSWEQVKKMKKNGKLWMPYPLEKAMKDDDGATSSGASVEEVVLESVEAIHIGASV